MALGQEQRHSKPKGLSSQMYLSRIPSTLVSDRYAWGVLNNVLSWMNENITIIIESRYHKLDYLDLTLAMARNSKIATRNHRNKGAKARSTRGFKGFPLMGKMSRLVPTPFGTFVTGKKSYFFRLFFYSQPTLRWEIIYRQNSITVCSHRYTFTEELFCLWQKSELQ